MVNPTPKIIPNVDYKLKTVTIKLRDTLLANTTYSIQLGNSIQDINENNPYPDFTYVFSTGAYIDSLQFSGNVILAETGKADSTLLVFLYKNLSDSAVYKEKPIYIEKVNSKGDFKFKHLAEGTYNVFALKDESGQKMYNNPTQLFAFADSSIKISDEVKPIQLYAFAEEKSFTKPATENNKTIAQKILKYTTSISGGTQDLLSPITLKFSNKFELDDIVFEEPVPNLFSFNNPFGACPVCEGFSMVLGLDHDLVIPDKRLSVYEGAVAPWKGEKLSLWKENFVRAAKQFDFPVHKPIMDLTDAQLKDLWSGNKYAEGINDFFKEVEQNLYKVQYRVLLSRFRGRTLCGECEGYRLRKVALYVKIAGVHIGQLCEMPVKDLQTWFDKLKLSKYDEQVAKRILIEVKHRLKTLLDVGLGYLTLNRLANSLSGGESQRIQLTRSLGSNLTNSLYILDEPSIGLHSRDTQNLIVVLKELRDLGNTVVVVEHDEMMMREADHIIDMGPLASHLGGEVIAVGNYDELIANEKSLTGKYLSGKLKIEVPKLLRKWNRSIKIEGAKQNNLKDINVEFPLNILCAISGVSGSGKTTLVKQILYPALQKIKGEVSDKPGLYRKITGDIDYISRIEMVDQNPIGKSSRSNPVTYIKAYDEIRELYSKQPLSKIRGFMPKHFSFNVDGGRCDACKGEGEQLVEMQFLADVHLVCDVCNGKRFKEEVLEVTYKEKSIHDVLEMSVDEAIGFFGTPVEKLKSKTADDGADVAKKIQPLSDVGLGYIKLGQSSNTLSGGEAQRVKLASFLGKGKAIGHILFIFDEPTTGLHFHDIKKLLNPQFGLPRSPT